MTNIITNWLSAWSASSTLSRPKLVTRFLRNSVLVVAATLLTTLTASVHAADKHTEEHAQHNHTHNNEASSSLPEVTVWHSPTCGCCTDWIDHIKEYGFPVRAHSQNDVAMIKHRLGLPSDLASCHTAMVDGYVIEGHVPAKDIARLLKERPFMRGLSVPNMPIGSPGMEMGERVDNYEVLLFDEQGETKVFSRYPE